MERSDDREGLPEMAFEETLARLMRQGERGPVEAPVGGGTTKPGSHLTPALIDVIVKGAIVRAKRRRRRRAVARSAQVAAAVLAVTTIAVGVRLQLGRSAPGGEVSVVNSPAATGSATADPGAGRAGRVLAALMPPGQVTDVSGSVVQGVRVGSLHYRNGARSGTVWVIVGSVSGGSVSGGSVSGGSVAGIPDAVASPGTRDGSAAWTCTTEASGTCLVRQRPDGSVVKTVHRQEAGSPAPELAGAAVRRPDGVVVAVNERNATTPKGGPVTSDGLPLSVDQLVAIATANVW